MDEVQRHPRLIARKDGSPLGAPPQHLLFPDQDLRVHEIGTKEIRYLAMALIAVTAGVIAGQGLLAATILTGVVLIGGLIIQGHAETKFLDLNSNLSTAAKVELFIHSYFWGQTLLVSTLAGLTGALAFCGASAMMNEAFFQGLALHLLAWIGFVPFAQSGIASVARLGNDTSVLRERLTALHQSLARAHLSGGLPATLSSFLLKQFLSTDTKVEAFFQEVHAHSQENNIAIDIYFKFLLPILTPDMVYRFTVDYPLVIDWPFLLDNLSKDMIRTYSGEEKLQAIALSISGSEANQCSQAQLFKMLTSLRTFELRLSNLPDVEDEDLLDVASLHQSKTTVERLQQQTQSLLDARTQEAERLLVQFQISIERSPSVEMRGELAALLAHFDGLPDKIEDEALATILQPLQDCVARIKQLQTRLEELLAPARD